MKKIIFIAIALLIIFAGILYHGYFAKTENNQILSFSNIDGHYSYMTVNKDKTYVIYHFGSSGGGSSALGFFSSKVIDKQGKLNQWNEIKTLVDVTYFDNDVDKKISIQNVDFIMNNEELKKEMKKIFINVYSNNQKIWINIKSIEKTPLADPIFGAVYGDKTYVKSEYYISEYPELMSTKTLAENTGGYYEEGKISSWSDIYTKFNDKKYDFTFYPQYCIFDDEYYKVYKK